MCRSKFSLRVQSPLWCLSVGLSLCLWLWTCAVVVYVLSNPQWWAMPRYVRSLFQSTRLAIPLLAPPPRSASVLSLRVQIGESLLMERDVPLLSVHRPPVLQAESPVRLAGSLMIHVTALDESGCVVATASTHYQASGEAQIQVPLRLTVPDVPKCSLSSDRAADAATFANRN